MRRRRTMFARRRSRWRVWLAVLAVAVIVGGAVALYGTVVVPLVRTSPRPSHSPSPSPTPPPTCTSSLPGSNRLGSLAFVRDGALHVFDLPACTDHVVVKSGVEAPVRFSGDGRWVAFGDGTVVPSKGGKPTRPLGEPVVAWAWSAGGNALAGISKVGDLVVGAPGGGRKTIARGVDPGAGLAFSPDGTQIAIDYPSQGVEVVQAKTGAVRVVFPVAAGAPAPRVAGWSPDGKDVLFWPRRKGQKAADGLELRAAPAAAGGWFQVVPVMLPDEDLIASCGSGLAIAVGPGPYLTRGQQVVLTGPPRWRFDNLTHDYLLSWMWPACSPDGHWLAVTASANHREGFPGGSARSLRLIATDHTGRVRITRRIEEAFELPRWSADGQVLMYIRRGLRAQDPGIVFLAAVDPKTGKVTGTTGPVVGLGPSPDFFGHFAWAEQTDWYRPG